jgi:hypothetical protein
VAEREDEEGPAPQRLRDRPAMRAEQYQHRHFESGDHGSVAASIETVPVAMPGLEDPPRHDPFWGSIYLISLLGLFATSFLVFLHTSAPRKSPLGDTIYTTLRASFHLLGVDTLASILVGLVWLALLRSFARTLVYLLLVSVPVVLAAFSLYPFVWSFGAESQGLQSAVMRCFAFVPAVLAGLWVYTLSRGRHSLSRAIGILEFSSRVLQANSALLAQGFAALAVVVLWTWLWILVFTRVFLGGHVAGSVFVIDVTTWWLGVAFVLVYLWTLAMISGIQRTTTAATVSQWYFHRNAEPAVPSSTVVYAALQHSLVNIFGTIAYSTLLALLVRLPFLLLPRRVISLLSILAYSLIPTSLAILMDPLTLTYAAIRSQALGPSARALGQMSFLAPAISATAAGPHRLPAGAASPLLPYRLAKLLLHATRFLMAAALGLGGWVATARMLAVDVPGGGVRGSAYAYVVGLVAGAIGWGVLGTIEGVLGGIVDAALVCHGVERGASGAGGYCLEAAYLFGGGELPR